MPIYSVELNEQERMALNNFIGEYWEVFRSVAADFLDDDELAALQEKLGGD